MNDINKIVGAQLTSSSSKPLKRFSVTEKRQFTFRGSKARDVTMRKVAIFVMCTVWFLAIHLFGVEAILAQNGQINADDTIDAISYGDCVHFGWIDLPEGTTKIVLSRASNQAGPWLAVLIDEYLEDLTSSGSLLYTDSELVPPDTTNGYFYKLESFSARGILMKSYPPVFVPIFSP